MSKTRVKTRAICKQMEQRANHEKQKFKFKYLGDLFMSDEKRDGERGRRLRQAAAVMR